MKRLLIAAVVIPSLWATVRVASSFAQTADTALADKLLIDHERKIFEAVTKGDKASFVALVADDGVWASGDGFVPMKLVGDAFDQMNVTRSDLVNPQVLWINPTTAVVAYAWTGSRTFMGQQLAPRMITSTVWTKRSDKWVAIYHQESDAPRQ